MNRFLYAVALSSVLAAPTAPAFGQSLSRREAVTQALAANPEVKLSQEQLVLLESRIREAKADALPDITWNSVAMRARDPGLLNSPNFDSFPEEFRTALSPLPANAFSTSADVRQTLFSFKLGHALEGARIARVAGDLDLDRARRTTALDAVRAYNQLLFAIEQLRVVETNVASRQTHLEYARNRRAAGVATELEVLRAEVDVENQRAEVFRAENDVTAARARLNTIMVRPTSTPIDPTDRLTVVPLVTTFDEAVAEALNVRPELKLLRTEDLVQGKLMDVIAADTKPRLDFEGAYGFSVRRPKNLFQWDYSRWSAVFSLKVPLFDGWRTDSRVAQAQSQRNTVALHISALQNQIRLDVQTALDALALADRTIRTADLNAAQARRVVEMTEANYRLGASTNLDVVDAQQALRQADNTRTLALYTHANARAWLRFVMGRDPLDP